ncbi:hypothetical protein [Noviherbaspirillum album]|nr:hypothetical protein [Noviherbaspirillum sp. CPCC 100848]
MPEQESAKPDVSQATETAGAQPDNTPPQPEPRHTLTDEAAEADTPLAMKAAAMIGNNKGKLAIGAAAMLGMAVFYKWRDSKLAKEDPEEYARLRRIKAGLESGVDAGGDTEAEPEKKD